MVPDRHYNNKSVQQQIHCKDTSLDQYHLRCCHSILRMQAALSVHTIIHIKSKARNKCGLKISI